MKKTKDNQCSETLYMLPRCKKHILYYSKTNRFGNDKFNLKIGGTYYDISIHFNADGRQSVLQQFRDLIVRDKLI